MVLLFEAAVLVKRAVHAVDEVELILNAPLMSRLAAGLRILAVLTFAH